MRLMGKRQIGQLEPSEFVVTMLVANLASIPVGDSCVQGAVHLFAPFNAEEFSRILAPEGVLLSVIPGKNHLMGLKKVLYDVFELQKLLFQ